VVTLKIKAAGKGKADAGAAGRAVAGAGTVAAGAAAEDLALTWLQQRGLTLVRRNYRVARGPGARGGEIDLILRDTDGTLVFCEVRARKNARHGGAAATVGAAKQRALVFAAQHFLLTLRQLPPCRFDVLAVDAGRVEWLRGAFDA
jgi:putative endonuclease